MTSPSSPSSPAASSPSGPSTPLRPVLMLVAATACWGCGTVLSKQALVAGVEPLSLLVVELAASCLTLLLVLRLVPGRLPASRAGLRRLALLGLLNPGLAYVLATLGLVSISASMAVLLWATEPVIVLVLAALVLGERAGGRAYAAVAVAVVGAVLVVHAPGAAGAATGVALTLAAVTACGVYAVLTRRLLLDDSSLLVVLGQQALALLLAVTLAAAAGLGGLADVGLPPSARAWAFAVVSGVVYYAAAFVLFVSGLRGSTASRAGSLLPLVPVFGLTAGWVAGDRLAPLQWAGVVLVVAATSAAATVGVSRRRRPARERAPRR